MITLVLGPPDAHVAAVAADLLAGAGTVVVAGHPSPALTAAPELAAVEVVVCDDHRELPAVLVGVDGPAVVLSLDGWVAAAAGEQVDAELLVAAVAARRAPTIVVTRPPAGIVDAAERVLAEVNAALARRAGRVLLVVDGVAVPLSHPSGP